MGIVAIYRYIQIHIYIYIYLFILSRGPIFPKKMANSATLNRILSEPAWASFCSQKASIDTDTDIDIDIDVDIRYRCRCRYKI